MNLEDIMQIQFHKDNNELIINQENRTKQQYVTNKLTIDNYTLVFHIDKLYKQNINLYTSYLIYKHFCKIDKFKVHDLYNMLIQLSPVNVQNKLKLRYLSNIILNPSKKRNMDNLIKNKDIIFYSITKKVTNVNITKKKKNTNDNIKLKKKLLPKAAEILNIAGSYSKYNQLKQMVKILPNVQVCYSLNFPLNTIEYH